MSSLRITYKKSIIGYSKDQKDTVRSLGLRKLNQVVVRPDSPSLRGMLFKVRHLVAFEEVDDTVETAQPKTRQSFAPRVIAAPPAEKAAAPREMQTFGAPVEVAEEPTVVAEPIEVAEVAEPTVAAEPVEVQTIAAPAAEEAAAPATPDDIEVIEGIGPKIAEALAAAGITTFAQLADTDVDQLRAILQDEPRLRLADPTTWPEQARLAAAGQWNEFKELTDRLKGGRESA